MKQIIKSFCHSRSKQNQTGPVPLQRGAVCHLTAYGTAERHPAGPRARFGRGIACAQCHCAMYCHLHWSPAKLDISQGRTELHQKNTTPEPTPLVIRSGSFLASSFLFKCMAPCAVASDGRVIPGYRPLSPLASACY